MSPQSALAESLAEPAESSVAIGPVTAAPVDVSDRTCAARIVFDRLPIESVPAFPAASPRALRLVPTRAEPALEPASRPIPREVAAPVHRLRLTLRGRLVLVVVAVLLTCGIAVLARVSASSGGGSAASQPSGIRPSLVVQPGDTLWSIATKLAPNADPRSTIARIVDLNRLGGTALYAGEQLRLPS
jgi:hypothetical protein